jgi:hypothetical protein
VENAYGEGLGQRRRARRDGPATVRRGGRFAVAGPGQECVHALSPLSLLLLLSPCCALNGEALVRATVSHPFSLSAI